MQWHYSNKKNSVVSAVLANIYPLLIIKEDQITLVHVGTVGKLGAKFSVHQ